ncbi:DMT family transporter [Ideonella livida]|uniref:DMT family transporter n=1 Tax=Ideonella livida TaxID=2707176 RepID=A0A7C9TKL8_9BURK|nr:DMT family transporter [Ideonella livida]NDY91962.1 DMT family transporter [Ideonella livida]
MTARRLQLDPFAIVCLVGCAALWGLNQSATKLAVAEIPPLGQAAARSAGAALLLALWTWARGGRLALGAATWRAGLLAGLLFAIEFGAIFVGLQYTTASRMVVYIYLAPFFVALGMPFIQPGERLGLPQLAGLGLAFSGVVLAFSEHLGGGSAAPNGQAWWGDALGVGGAALWAATTLTIRASTLSSAPAERTLMYQLLVSAVLLGLASVAVGESLPAQVSTLAWGSLAFQTVVVTFASYLLWFWLMARYPATQISAFTLLTPVFGLAAGVALLDEPLTLRLGIALAAVVAGLALVQRAPRKP